MDVFEAIHSRRSQDKVKPDPLPREIIEKLLSAAVQAPNHYKVRPWRFVVLTGAGRDKLGEVMAASQQERHPEFAREVFDKTRALPLRAPVVIAVGVDKPSEAKVLEIENVCATAAAAPSPGSRGFFPGRRRMRRRWRPARRRCSTVPAGSACR